MLLRKLSFEIPYNIVHTYNNIAYNPAKPRRNHVITFGTL